MTVSTMGAWHTRLGHEYSPTDEPVVPFENAAGSCEGLRLEWEGQSHVLVVRIANPGESARDTDSDSDVGDDAGYEHGVVVVLVVDEDENHSEYEPRKARCRTSRVDAAQVLQHGGTSKPEP